MKYFLITIDTESDNQWQQNSVLSAENAKYIPRFQQMCEKYGFLPVYLTDYTMASDDYYCGFMKEKLQDGRCEIGMHLHAWDTPPFHPLDQSDNKPYLVEYPKDIMAEKVKTITDKLESTFKTKMKSHRAGRWAMNESYAQLLIEQGYTSDCSVTPGVSWTNQMGGKTGGSDYTAASKQPYYLDVHNQLLEVPMTVRKLRVATQNVGGGVKGLARFARNVIFGKNVWLRPSICTEEEISALLAYMRQEDTDYLEFMIHSSEFMPGGSPYYPTEQSIDELFAMLDRLFEKIAQGYRGCTMEDFVKTYQMCKGL